MNLNWFQTWTFERKIKKALRKNTNEVRLTRFIEENNAVNLTELLQKEGYKTEYDYELIEGFWFYTVYVNLE